MSEESLSPRKSAAPRASCYVTMLELEIGFTENDIVNAVDECKEYYDETIRNRVKYILPARRNKFRYLIK